MPIGQSFGEYLRQFALSVDFIDSNHYKQVQDHITEYLESQLESVQVALFEPYTDEEQPALRSVWSKPKWHTSSSLKEGNEYTRQLALGIGEKRNLWVVSEDGKPLSDSNRGIDHWGGRQDKNLPPFPPSPGRDSRTSIVLMTKDARNQFNGALLIEIERKIEITAVLKEELSLIAQATGLLHATDLTTQEQRESTFQAIRHLGKIRQNASLNTTGARPLLFFAFPERAHEQVIKVIDQVLSQYEDYISVCRWNNMQNAGNIQSQIAENIRKAKYGICYFSEPATDKDTSQQTNRFNDNHNVLLEAGMLHISTSSSSDTSTGWIPIREQDSPELPFDLLGQRLTIVPRNESGHLKPDQFEKELSAKLKALLKDEDDSP